MIRRFMIFNLRKHVLETNLQTALNELNGWCEQNWMLLNTAKTNVMLISTRQNKSAMTDNKLNLHMMI